ncbi:hypothetical protein OAF54_03390 [bacterium]|nr:hypothetical protein [bacterium]
MIKENAVTRFEELLEIAEFPEDEYQELVDEIRADLEQLMSFKQRARDRVLSSRSKDE